MILRQLIALQQTETLFFPLLMPFLEVGEDFTSPLSTIHSFVKALIPHSHQCILAALITPDMPVE